MIVKKPVAFAIAALLLFSSSVPVYASNVKKLELTTDEERLFEKIFARLESHSSMMPVQVDDVKKSLSESRKFFFACTPFNNRVVESVSINVRTKFVPFDRTLAEKHKPDIYVADYTWDCETFKDNYTITIECVNRLMLNPDFMIKEETETDGRRSIAMAENEMYLYHELLHGQLMIDAMNYKSSDSDWKKESCSFFANNKNEPEYSPSDVGHRIIPNLELDFLAKIVKLYDGMLIIKTIDKGNVVNSEFSEVVVTFAEMGALADKEFFPFSRTINIEQFEILVSEENETITISGSLQDANSDAVARIIVMPKTTISNVKLNLEVDNPFKSIGSEFMFTLKIRNQHDSDISGTLRLGIDGMVVAHQNVDVPTLGEKNMEFLWKSGDLPASKNVVKVDGFNSESNEVNVFTFDKLESRTVIGSGTIADQVFEDPDTKERISIARPNRISAIISIKNNTLEVQLLAPNGTAVIGKDGLVIDVGKRVNIVKVNDQNLAVKYTELSETLRFFAVKMTKKDTPLTSGEWGIRVIDSAGNDADTRIKYFVKYIA